MPEVVLDDAKRMSNSLLWKLQKDAYQQFGIQAWGKFRVPSYITSNPFTGKGYSSVVLGFLRDCLRNGTLDAAHPIYLFDLGAGSGRFSYFFIKKLTSYLETLKLTNLDICLVLTDISEENINYWQNHPALKPYFDKGTLDCAYFENSQSNPIELIKRKIKIDQSTLVNPAILLANYFFDTVPHDLFRVNDGHLEEGLVTISASYDEGVPPETINPNEPAIIKHLKSNYAYKRCSSDYYEDQRLNEILKLYEKEFNECPFLFPIGGFQTLMHFFDWSQGRMLLMSGDHGVCTDEQLRKWGEPQLAIHGSFSLGVNFNAILRFFLNQGGEIFYAFADTLFGVVAAAIDKKHPGNHFHETRLAFDENIIHFEPKDYWELVNQTEKHWKEPSLEHLLLLLKYGMWDAMSFQTFFNAIRNTLGSATERQKERLLEMIFHTRDSFYIVTEESGNFILNLGVLLYDLHRYQDSLDFFILSNQITKPNATVLKNMAICYRILGDEAAAVECETKAVGLPEIDAK